MSNQELVDYITLHTSRGVAKESILSVLRDAGWQETDIREAYEKNTPPPIPAPPPSSPSPVPPPPPKYKPNIFLGAVSTICIIAGIGGALYYLYQNPTIQTIVAKQFQKQSSTLTPTAVPSPIIQNSLLEPTPFESTSAGFLLTPPKSWRIDTSGQFGTLVFFFSNVTEKEGENPFTPNINVTSESIEGIDLDTYMKAVKEKLPATFTEYKLVEEAKITVNGLPATKIIATFTQGVYHIQNIQTILIRAGKAYIITGTTLANSWEKDKEILQSSMLTFKL